MSSTQTLTLTSRKPSCSDLPIPGDLTRHPISIHVSSPSHPTRRVVTSRRESRPSFFPLPSVRVPHLPRPQSPLARTAPLLPLSFPSLSHFLFLYFFFLFPISFSPFLFFLFLFSPSLLPFSPLCLAPARPSPPGRLPSPSRLPRTASRSPCPASSPRARCSAARHRVLRPRRPLSQPARARRPGPPVRTRTRAAHRTGAHGPRRGRPPGVSAALALHRARPDTPHAPPSHRAVRRLGARARTRTRAARRPLGPVHPALDPPTAYLRLRVHRVPASPPLPPPRGHAARRATAARAPPSHVRRPAILLPHSAAGPARRLPERSNRRCATSPAAPPRPDASKRPGCHNSAPHRSPDAPTGRHRLTPPPPPHSSYKRGLRDAPDHHGHRPPHPEPQ